MSDMDDTDDRAEAGPPREVDAAYLRELAELIAETGLTEIEIKRHGVRIRLARAVQTVAVAEVPTLAPTAPPAPFSPPPPATAPAGPRADAAPAGAVTSPMVGTVYVASAPGADPFVAVGDRVEEGQTLLIIEAMKTMNHIPAPRAGTVAQILVEDGEPVEYGQPLLAIE